MAQRNSRKGKVRKKQPELRTGGGRRAKAQRAQERQVTVERSSDRGLPVVRMRPAGAVGIATLLLLAWLGVALVALAGLLLERWNVVGYPDSLWLYVAFGCVAVAPAVGRVGRTAVDADAWGVQSLVVPVGLFVAEAVAGPECPTGAACDSVGARGALGLAGSLAVLALLAALAWGLARWQFSVADRARPARGRVRLGALVMTVLGMLLFPGALLAAGLVGTDLLTRDTPELAQRAVEEVERECYGLQAAPRLVPRAAPEGYNSGWTTFAVHRAGEDRPGVGDEGLPKRWATLDYVHPYEATASFNADREVVSVTCRRIGPGTGNATADDLKDTPPDSNPLSPKTTGTQFLPRFFTQGVAGPSEEAKRKAREDAAAKRKADAGGAKGGDTKDAAEQ